MAGQSLHSVYPGYSGSNFGGFTAGPSVHSGYPDYSHSNFGGSAAGSNEGFQPGGLTGFFPYTRNPSLTSYGPAFAPNLYEPGLGSEFTNFPQIRPDHGHNQIEQFPYDGNQAALAHFAELDSMNAPGYGRR